MFLIGFCFSGVYFEFKYFIYGFVEVWKDFNMLYRFLLLYFIVKYFRGRVGRCIRVSGGGKEGR